MILESHVREREVVNALLTQDGVASQPCSPANEVWGDKRGRYFKFGAEIAQSLAKILARVPFRLLSIRDGC